MSLQLYVFNEKLFFTFLFLFVTSPTFFLANDSFLTASPSQWHPKVTLRYLSRESKTLESIYFFLHISFLQEELLPRLLLQGFRKIASDRWEFGNDFFRRGAKDLLCDIRRRRSTPSSQATAHKQNHGPPSPDQSNSFEDQRSSFTSSPKSSLKNHSSHETTATQFSNISDENEKLRKDNHFLISELADAKRQCEGLLVFLCNYLNVDREKINSIMLQGGGDLKAELYKEDVVGEEEDCMKLFGVWLKNKKKRGCRDGEEGLVMGPLKERKMEYDAPWMKTCPSPGGESSKVCN